jgi:hypothetical protein
VAAFLDHVLFRHATKAVLSRIRNRRTIAMVAILRPTLGLPAIMEEAEMLILHLSFPGSWSNQRLAGN